MGFGGGGGEGWVGGWEVRGEEVEVAGVPGEVFWWWWIHGGWLMVGVD